MPLSNFPKHLLPGSELAAMLAAKQAALLPWKGLLHPMGEALLPLGAQLERLKRR
jgi:hypothetical protein